MTYKLIQKSQQVKIADISTEYRIRKPIEAHVDNIEKMWKDKGVMKNLTLALMDGSLYIAGGNHRLEMFTRIGEQTVPSDIYEVSNVDDIFDLAEVDNLQRENTAYDDAYHIRAIAQAKGLTFEEVGMKRTGKGKQAMATLKSLLTMPVCCVKYLTTHHSKATEENPLTPSHVERIASYHPTETEFLNIIHTLVDAAACGNVISSKVVAPAIAQLNLVRDVDKPIREKFVESINAVANKNIFHITEHTPQKIRNLEHVLDGIKDSGGAQALDLFACRSGENSTTNSLLNHGYYVRAVGKEVNRRMNPRDMLTIQHMSNIFSMRPDDIRKDYKVIVVDPCGHVAVKWIADLFQNHTEHGVLMVSDWDIRHTAQKYHHLHSLMSYEFGFTNRPVEFGQYITMLVKEFKSRCLNVEVIHGPMTCIHTYK